MGKRTVSKDFGVNRRAINVWITPGLEISCFSFGSILHPAYKVDAPLLFKDIDDKPEKNDRRLMLFNEVAMILPNLTRINSQGWNSNKRYDCEQDYFKSLQCARVAPELTKCLLLTIGPAVSVFGFICLFLCFGYRGATRRQHLFSLFWIVAGSIIVHVGLYILIFNY